MPENHDFEPFEPQTAGADPAAVGQGADLRRLRDVPVGLTVEIGRAQMTVGETLTLRPGAIVKLDRLAEEPLDLLVNGTRIARGEVVVIDEDFGLRITEVVVAGTTVAGVAAPAPIPDTSDDSAGTADGVTDAEIVEGEAVESEEQEAAA